ncbi:glutathione S-transferase N-terminal domain-containing protein [Piscinibacter sp. Jin2]|uniref:Glutathione S-transferase N-terminal domain-containing protein n=1 Tax=Aquariibacter lacus TaxID=2801332 RepID=A0A9X1BPX1_9BURK|nr:glutathione S-transferase N-terminal domain-containing protein [Piscinibacter lacus]MBL0718951.1 glutathione S-transferase N-terminal domain-containing protein [Piscinibacter lacus]
MKLYYSPGACSLAPHLIGLELGLALELVFASPRSKKLKDGSDFLAINPKGQVPVLELDDGERITEVAVILQVLADLSPGASLLAPHGERARLRALEWLSFTATELHKSYGPLFKPGIDPATQAYARSLLAGKLAWVEGEIARRDAAGQPWLLPQGFSVADAYLYNVLSWNPMAGVDDQPYPALRAYVARVQARPAVGAARRAEGLKD